MPNSWLPASTNVTRGLVVLGDALNMRHPLTGGGMTVAFNDVVLLSELLDPIRVAQFDDTKAVLAAMQTWHWRRKRLTSVINILAQALYALFAADGKRVLRSFTYQTDNSLCRSSAQDVTTGLLSLFPAWRGCHLGSDWSSWRHHPKSVCIVLSLLRRCTLLHLDFRRGRRGRTQRCWHKQDGSGG